MTAACSSGSAPIPARSGEMCLRTVQWLAVEEGVDLLVVEGDQAGDGQQLAGREVVAPGQVRVSSAARLDGPVAAGRALVRAGGHGASGDQVGEVDLGAAQVVAGGQA